MPSPIARDIDAVQSIGGLSRILKLAAAISGSGFACIARVTQQAWTACAVYDEISFGLQAGYDLEVSITVCDEVHHKASPVAIDHASDDPAYCNQPMLKQYGFESCISLPVYRRDGSYFGTLCALDYQPQALNNARVISQMTLLAEMVSLQLPGLNEAPATPEPGLDTAAMATLGEQYRALLGHDVRAPLRAIADGIEQVLRATPNPALRSTLEETRRNAFRLSGQLGDVLDFTRAKLSGGITNIRAVTNTLEADCRQVVAHWQKEFPEREIGLALAIEAVVNCDRVRIAQLLSILLANALYHGDAHAPVRVRASSAKSTFLISVENRGPALSAECRAALFEPYWRSPDQDRQAGLGLGLFIAAQIARAHDGKLDVSSTGDATVFTFSMPI